MDDVEALIADALAQPLEGWDFSYLSGRVETLPLPWDYRREVRHRLAYPVLDMGTGGGEFLSGVGPFAGPTVATEAWEQNVRVAASRLQPLGVLVVHVDPAPENADFRGTGGDLAFGDGAFALVVNRHESFSPVEVRRVLSAGGTFVTQQVGERNDAEINEALGASVPAGSWSLGRWVEQLESAGLVVVEARQGWLERRFLDVAAVVFHLRRIPWQIPDFDAERYRDRLAALHARMRERGGLVTRGHRYLLVAVRP